MSSELVSKKDLKLLWEIPLLFAGIPLLFYLNLVPIPKILALVLVALYCGVRLWLDDSFPGAAGGGSEGVFGGPPPGRTGNREQPADHSRVHPTGSCDGFTDPARIGNTILKRSLGVAAVIIMLVLLTQSRQFLDFPVREPLVWMLVMVLYPVLSALPQEFIYRTYFFHRYRGFFAGEQGMILASAAAFSFLHIVYDNWWAIGLSFVAGLLFGLTYARTRSLFWVTVEHAIYGGLVFTLGMGNYFYEAF